MVKNDKEEIKRLKEILSVYETMFTNMCILIKTPEGIEVLRKMIGNAAESKFKEIEQR